MYSAERGHREKHPAAWTKTGEKKAPVGAFGASTEADQPGMGMTDRVLPAQGEERGAYETLTGLEGGVLRKFRRKSLPAGSN